MLNQIIDGAPLASFVIDHEHRVTHWNTACERLTGLKREQAIGRNDTWRLFYAEERPMLADLILDGAEAKRIAALFGTRAWPSQLMPGGFEAENWFPGMPGGGAWLYVTAVPLVDDAGRTIGAIETLQDVTERRREQEELERHRSELQGQVVARSAEAASATDELERFIANAPLGVVYTVDGDIERCNHAFAVMFGYTRAQMQGMPAIQCVMHPRDITDLARRATQATETGDSLRLEMWLRHASGRPIWVQMDGYVAQRPDGRRGIWWMMQDRSDILQAQKQLRQRLAELSETNGKLEQAQNQLLQADKMASIGQLAAGVAHEINNPIGFVSSNLNSLREYLDGLLGLISVYEVAFDAPDDPQASAAVLNQRSAVEIDYLREDLPQLMAECSEGLTRVKKIVQDLKDFSRVDQADWHEADLNEGLDSTLNMVRHEIKYRCEVVRQLGELPPVMCLAAQLNQVFMNLVVNASHAIAEHGTITLSSGTEGPWAWVEVADSGCGMSAEVRRRIFEPFYTTKEVGKGTGLGLSLSFSIVRKHGGELQVRSAPGQGSAFRVWVPVGGPDSLPKGTPPPAWAEGVPS